MTLVVKSCLVSPLCLVFVSGIPPGPYSNPTESYWESIFPLEWLEIDQAFIESCKEDDDLWNILSEL